MFNNAALKYFENKLIWQICLTYTERFYCESLPIRIKFFDNLNNHRNNSQHTFKKFPKFVRACTQFIITIKSFTNLIVEFQANMKMCVKITK